MIPEIRKILYATDLSDNARFAFNYAIRIANQFGARISIIYVLEKLSPSAFLLIKEFIGEERWAELEERSESQVISSIRSSIEGFCDEVNGKIPERPFIVDEIIVKKGHPVDQIVGQSEKTDCDMVVMGSRGQGMLAETVLGSVSRGVLRRCRKPVLIARLPEKE